MSGSISSFSVIPVRKEPAEQSEMETQILFGEVFYELEAVQGWRRVRLAFDAYEGWIDEKYMVATPDREIELWNNSPGILVTQPVIKLIREPEKSVQYVPAGSRIAFNGEIRNSFSIGNREYYYQNTTPERKPELEEVARGFLNAPYLWGGRTFMGIDCSGLSQLVFKLMGYPLPRNASQQIELGKMVSFVEEARAGDLAFFDNEDGNIVHVGICLGNGRILHASGEVRLDHLDHQGIFSQEARKYTHHLRVIKRIID